MDKKAASSCRRRGRRKDSCPPKQVNPLKRAHQGKLEGVVISEVLPAAPMIFDLGCGEGEWVAMAAERFPSHNFVGLDVRDGALPPSSGGNCHYVAANASDGDFALLLREAAGVALVLAQYCDPNWKGRHRKRRMLTPSLCRAVALALAASDGRFVVRTDVPEVAANADASAAETPSLLRRTHDDPFVTSLLAIPTERELYVRRKDPTFTPYVRIYRPDASLSARVALHRELRLLPPTREADCR